MELTTSDSFEVPSENTEEKQLQREILNNLNSRSDNQILERLTHNYQTLHPQSNWFLSEEYIKKYSAFVILSAQSVYWHQLPVLPEREILWGDKKIQDAIYSQLRQKNEDYWIHNWLVIWPQFFPEIYSDPEIQKLCLNLIHRRVKKGELISPQWRKFFDKEGDDHLKNEIGHQLKKNGVLLDTTHHNR